MSKLTLTTAFITRRLASLYDRAHTSMRLLFSSVPALAMCLFMLPGAQTAHASAVPEIRALWVYPDPAQPALNPVLNPAAGRQLVANAHASGVNAMYLSVYSSTANANGQYMYDETLLGNLVDAAHATGIQVYAAYGDTDWPALGCGTAASPSFPIQRIHEVNSYNVRRSASDPNGKLDGVILDVEPALADQNLLDLYACSLQTGKGYGLNMATAINAFWTGPIGSGGPAYQQILNQGFDHVVVMGYRNFAGTFGANDNGILALDTAAVAYGSYHVLVGLETQDMGAGDPQNTQSFYAFGQAALDYQAQSVINQFNAHGLYFGGFAIDNYAYAYLGGTANWPQTDATFPTGAASPPAGGPVSKSVAVGSTTVAIAFTNNSNPGYTVSVTPVNTATQNAPAGFQLTSLGFEISTTAVFTGPVTVCFSVPSLDAATFAGLRILHYVGGVGYDQTVQTGTNAPNAVTHTICANVYSFSPFVLATPVRPFAAFSVKSLIVDPHGFSEQGSFTLATGSPGVNPVNDRVVFTFGSSTLAIPAKSFVRAGNNYVFFGVIQNVFLAVDISLLNATGTKADFAIAGFGLNLTGQAEPLKLGLQIGGNAGSGSFKANVRP